MLAQQRNQVLRTLQRFFIGDVGKIIESGTVESVALESFAIEWLEDRTADYKERAEYAARRPELGTKEQNAGERTTYRALSKDFAAVLKHAARLAR